MVERGHEISKLTSKTNKLYLTQYIHSSSLLSRFCAGVLVLGDRSTGMPMGLTGDRSRIMVDALESPSQSVVETSELTCCRGFFEGGPLAFLKLLTSESLFLSFLATCSGKAYIAHIQKR